VVKAFVTFDRPYSEHILAWYDLGVAYVHLTKTGDYYSWRKVETFIHNVIVGKLWIDHNGRTTITNHRNKDYCELIMQAKTREVQLDRLSRFTTTVFHCHYLFIYLFIYLLNYLLTYLFTYLFVYLLIYLLFYLLVYLLIYLLTYLPNYLNTY